MTTTTSFEQLVDGHPFSISAYHWACDIPTILTLGFFIPAPFYICDDEHAWESPNIKNMQLYLIKAYVQQPKILLEQAQNFEGCISSQRDAMMSKGYDSVFYTAADRQQCAGRTRQGALFFPNYQIKGIYLIR